MMPIFCRIFLRPGATIDTYFYFFPPSYIERTRDATKWRSRRRPLQAWIMYVHIWIWFIYILVASTAPCSNPVWFLGIIMLQFKQLYSHVSENVAADVTCDVPRRCVFLLESTGNTLFPILCNTTKRYIDFNYVS